MGKKKTGDIVNIYQKPVTAEDLEGEARCVQFVRHLPDEYEQHMVEFLGHENEGIFLRTILPARDFVRES